MKRIKIVLPEEDLQYMEHFQCILKQHCRMAEHKGLQYRIVCQEASEGMEFICQFWPKQGEHTIDTFDAISEAVSGAVSEYIVECKETDILREILIHELGFEEEQEITDIIQFTYSLINIDELGDECTSRRKEILHKQVLNKAKEYFDADNQIFMDGFLRFRLKDQWEQWKRALEHGIDEYMINREYSASFELMRQFVMKQFPSFELLHIVHIDDRNLLLFDQQWRSLYPFLKNGVTLDVLGQTIRYEDLLLSALISVAPERIIVHTDQNQHYIIHTIYKIFQERVTICEQCSSCQSQKASVEVYK